MQSGQKQVIIVGGWSPGPLLYLQRNFEHECIFIQPNIPIPPMGCSWCWDVSAVALVAVLVLLIWSCHKAQEWVNGGIFLFLTRLGLVVAGLGAMRFCIAGIVRGSVARGVAAVESIICRQNIALVVGFSWGGGVVAEMLKRGLVGGQGQPCALLLAPTTALMGKAACQRDTALQYGLDGQRVHVVHGRHDDTFCPHCERWRQTGATFHLVNDNHVLCSRSTQARIIDSFSSLLQIQSNDR